MPPPRRPTKAPPVISSWITRQVLLELDRRGVPADDLLARHGLGRALLMDQDAMVPLPAHAAFYRAAAEAAGDPVLAHAVGRRSHLGLMRVFGHRAASAATLGGAYAVYGRFLRIITDASVDMFTVQGDRYDAMVIRPHHGLFLPDDTIAMVEGIACFAEQAPVRPCRLVELAIYHPAPPFAAALREAFRVPISFGTGQTELRFAPGALGTPIAHADPAVRDEVLRDEALSLLRQEGSTVEEVAFRLGFASRSAFHRALRRWTGKTPGALRAGAGRPR